MRKPNTQSRARLCPNSNTSFVSLKEPGVVTKSDTPYEFGVKASIVTTNARAPGGQFVLHAKALPGNPYDGHTLGAIIAATEKLIGCAIERANRERFASGVRYQADRFSPADARAARRRCWDE
jgi:hypothetical protein